MSAADKKSVVSEVGSWIWGTIEGGFNEQQSISQIIVDAAIGMIPVVGDVTAARDLIAIVLQLIENPEKRKSKLSWILLAVLVFALLPVAGGIIKGIGKLILEAGEDVARHGELVQKIVDLVNHVGKGNAIKFLKELDFERYTGTIMSQWRKFAVQLDRAIGGVLRNIRIVIPEAMIDRLTKIQQGLQDLKALAERMIPDAIKDLNSRLKAIQEHIYEGTWHEIPDAARSSTREAEARLVEKETDAKAMAPPADPELPYPQNAPGAFLPMEGWPNLTLSPWTNAETGESRYISSFFGPIQPRVLEEGTFIRRIVTKKSDPAGVYWMYAKDFPKDGKSWREQWAVLDSFSDNGYYVELRVPKGGLHVWEGQAASQLGSTAQGAQKFPGGANQLLVDFRETDKHAGPLAEGLTRKPTGWTDFNGLNVTPMSVDVESLGENEVEPRNSSGDSP
jgi:hypothetical protein